MEIEKAVVDEFTVEAEKIEAEIFAKQNVVAWGIGEQISHDQPTGKPCITVFVSQKIPEALLKADDLVGTETPSGIPLDVIDSGGPIMAGNPATPNNDVSTKEELGIEVLKQRIRPAMGGFSVGHYRITAGTIATCVYDRQKYGIPSKYYILSNNHVLANSNRARPGDPILQPGPYDGGTIPSDIIARLSRWVPIRFDPGTINLVDAAIAEGDFHNLNREIYWIGYVKQIKSNPQVGDCVEKTGRTTNFSTGKILALNANVNVNYGGGRVARFVKQIITTRMGAPGDSGSLVCDIKEGAVGLLFAGSSRLTIVNNILFVQSLLGIQLHP